MKVDNLSDGKCQIGKPVDMSNEDDRSYMFSPYKKYEEEKAWDFGMINEEYDHPYDSMSDEKENDNSFFGKQSLIII